MALRTVPQIKIGAFPQGTCLNGYIYNCDIRIGAADGEPTTITVNLINESGAYNVSKYDLSAVVPYTISVGTVVFKSMFLTSFSFSKTVGEKTLDLTFTDSSSILDKIQVLLLNKEASPYNMNSYKGTWNVGVGQIARTYYLPMVCQSVCEDTGYAPFNATGLAYNPWKLGEVTRALRQPWRMSPFEAFGNNRSGQTVLYGARVDKAMATNADLISGGSIIIGEEQFTSSQCAVPDVKYTFNELLAVLDLIGLKVKGLNDRGKPYLLERFGGSLRSVLNDWCALYGFTYAWDFSTNSIVGIDLHAPQTDIQSIHDLVNNLGDDGNGVAITNLQRTADLKGTYQQDSISSIVKPSKISSVEREFNKREAWIPFTINNFIPYVEGSLNWYHTTGGRSKNELITSAILAKYNPAARTLYNYYLMASKTNDFQNGSDIYGKVLGLSIRGKLSDSEKSDLLTFTMSLQERQKNQDKYGKDGACYLGTYSKELEDKWINWEKEIANSIGKYFYMAKPAGDTFYCSGFEHIVQTISSKPSAELYDGNNADNVPFEKLLKHPGGTILPAIDPITGKNFNQGFWVHSRSNSYGVKDEELDNLWYDQQGGDVLKETLPSHQVLEGHAKLFLDDLIEECFPDLYKKLEQIEDEKKLPSLFFFPVRAKVVGALDVSALQGTSGWDWVWATAPNLRQAAMYTPATGTIFNKHEYVAPYAGETDKSCDLWCDSDLFQQACECPEGDTFNPNFVGLTCAFSRWIRITVPGGPVGSIVIPLPSEYPFSGYVSVNSKYRKVQSAIYQHFGELTNAGGAMEYRVNINDITSDLESMAEQTNVGGPVEKGQESGQIPSFIPVPGMNTLQTAANYHTMTNTQHSSTEPVETLSFTMAGMNFNVLGKYLSVEEGMTSMSISLTDGGVQTSFSFSNKRYPAVADAFKFQRIGPRMNSNTFLRTF
jgi:hypothetical protein